MSIFDRLFRQKKLMDMMGNNSVAPDGIVKNNAPNNGLLSSNNKGFFGSFNNINPNLILGANMIGQGIQGKDPFSSFAPALQQTGQLQSQFMQMEEMKNKMAENKIKDSLKKILIGELTEKQEKQLHGNFKTANTTEA